MILAKLHEALAEVAPQRAALDDVEQQLRSMIAKMSDGSTIQVVPPSIKKDDRSPSKGERDRLDDIGDVLRAEGKPMHIMAIVARLSDISGKDIPRTLIEPGLNRHIAKAKNSRIAKFGPSTFGLPEWKVNSN